LFRLEELEDGLPDGLVGLEDPTRRTIPNAGGQSQIGVRGPLSHGEFVVHWNPGSPSLASGMRDQSDYIALLIDRVSSGARLSRAH
jgi:hypothetical protein